MVVYWLYVVRICLLVLSIVRSVVICFRLVLSSDFSLRIFFMSVFWFLFAVGFSFCEVRRCRDSFVVRFTVVCRCLIWLRMMVIRL